jgi:hypothetical protein
MKGENPWSTTRATAIATAARAAAAETPPGAGPRSAPGLSSDQRKTSGLAQGLGACRVSLVQPAGASRSLVETFVRLATATAALHAKVTRGALTWAALTARIRSLKNTQETIITHGFPPVFGIPYLDLIDDVIAQDSAAANVARAAASGNAASETSALAGIAQSDHTIGKRLSANRNTSP